MYPVRSRKLTMLPLVSSCIWLAVSCGGTEEAPADSVAPAAPPWTPAPSLVQARVGHTATLLQSGIIVVLGGETGGLVGGGGLLANAEMYDTATGGWLHQAPQ